MDKKGRGEEVEVDREVEKVVLREIAGRLRRTFGFLIPCKSVDMLCQAIESISVDKCVLKTHDVECTLSALYNLHEKVAKIIEIGQQNRVHKAKLKIGDLRVNVKVTRNDEAMPSKAEISAQMLIYDSDQKVESSEAKIKRLEKRIEELEFGLEFKNLLINESKDEEYCEEFNLDSNILKMPQTDEFLGIRKFTVQQAKVLIDKEWDAFDIKILKAKSQKKLKKLNLKKNKIQETELALRRKNLDIEKEKLALENSKNGFESQKSRFASQMNIKVTSLRSFTNDLSAFLHLSFNSDDLSNIEVNPEEIVDLDAEIGQLQQALKDLEIQYKCRSPGNRSQLESQMEHVKNQINTLKSLKVIKNATKTNTFSTTGSSNQLLDKSLSPKNIKSKKPPISKLSITFEEPEKRDEKDNELRRQLRIKELRIKEREEEAFINEERCLKYWDKNLDDKMVIENAKLALTEYKRYKDKYENRVDFAEKKILELNRQLADISRRESEFVQSKNIFDEEKRDYEKEKQEIANKVNALLKLLEKP
jgi:hypothetical protein